MSGGFLKPQKKGGHQVVTFTFSGELTQDQIDGWNEAILELKALFGQISMVAVTLRGDTTEAKFRKRWREREG